MFKNILFNTICGLAKIRSVHTYVIPWIHWFEPNCIWLVNNIVTSKPSDKGPVNILFSEMRFIFLHVSSPWPSFVLWLFFWKVKIGQNDLKYFESPKSRIIAKNCNLRHKVSSYLQMVYPIGHSNRDHVTSSKRGRSERFTTYMSKADLERLNKALQAPSLGGGCVIPITVPWIYDSRRFCVTAKRENRSIILQSTYLHNIILLKLQVFYQCYTKQPAGCIGFKFSYVNSLLIVIIEFLWFHAI